MLWRALKELPMDGSHFRRQAPIGPYVVDFFCPAKRLIIELDGGHHNEDDAAARDLERQRWLEHEGYRLIRFWNSEIASDLTAVLERILYRAVRIARSGNDAPRSPAQAKNANVIEKRPFLPSPGGAGSLRMQCAAGWGNRLSANAVLRNERKRIQGTNVSHLCGFTPPRSRCARSTLPLQGRVREEPP
ncbi:endonuclease domain-containing protein [Bradyrhizobium sp. DOA9]|uniref:endonuclease domain-containing protein n=1 Tax=Bradyrhizobium sp. DOA9 TaxID=1126627 RepID=UPI001FCD2536|nr:endonuclease domain-containing protein [Bradyrhizobium sp. DOA9]